MDTETRSSNLLFSRPKDLAEKLKPQERCLKPIEEKEAAWIDEDDCGFDSKAVPNTIDKTLYRDTLKRKYETLMGTPTWAKLSEKIISTDEYKDDKLLRTVGHLQKKRSIKLRKDILEFKLCPKLSTDSNKKPISCLEFHPTASVALVGGHSGTVTLFSIGGDVNNQLHSFKLQKFNLASAFITPDGTEAYISSNFKHDYCVYDLIKAEPKIVTLPRIIKSPKIFIMSPNGKYLAVADGFEEVYLLSTETKELIKILKHHNDVISMTFSHDCEKLYTFCKQGEVSVWNLSTFRAEMKFYDHGCVTASCIAASPCGRLLATGSGEGIVNIYETSNLKSFTEQVPVKVVQNLKTKITNLKFNASTEILSLGSAVYPNSVKLVHIPSYHVFSNFPPPKDLQRVNSVAFSPNSGFMALGNSQGTAYLFRLKHYKNY